MDFVFVYVTTADKEEARKIGRQLVEKRLAACVNIIDGMESIYRWEGNVESATEAVLLAKTTSDRVGAITAVVKALHGYSCPCVVSLPLGEGNPDYFAWLAGNVG